jgi:LPXTG-site transpeptidase (sortase) family protein
MPLRAKSRPAWLTTANALIVGGIVLLLGSGASVARGAIARDAARTRWAELEAQRAVTGAHAVTARSGRTAARGAPVARLMIPRLELDEVVVEGIGDAELRAGPGHMTGSVLPGGIGNSVISAHRDRHFRPLAKLVVGDTIVTESDAGNLTWSVTRLIVVNADAPALRESNQPRLTLTTCWPIAYFGTAPDRLIVEAEPVASRSTGD